MDKGQDGSFLVRASTHSPGNYVLSARVDGEVAHVIIKAQGGQFDVGGGPPFTTLNELITHYKTHSMIETSGRVISLKNPFNATSFMAKSIKDRVSELEKETGDIMGKAGFWEEFEVRSSLICMHVCMHGYMSLYCFVEYCPICQCVLNKGTVAMSRLQLLLLAVRKALLHFTECVIIMECML